MRQISIKELGKHLSKELADLPFEVIKYGRVIGVMVSPDAVKGTDNINKGTDIKAKTTNKGTDKVKSTDNPVEIVKEQLTDIIVKKVMCTQPEATVATGGSFFNPQPKKK